jgi:RNA polymerase sigma-70 factor (ECF subfamily)
MDIKAFERVAREQKDRLFSYAARMLRHPAEAQDVAQEALVRLWQHRGQVDGDTARFWLRRTTHNLCIDRLRRRRSSPEVDVEPKEAISPDERLGPGRLAEASELGGLIEDALGKLSPRDRAVLVLREVQGLPYAEIAEILDVPLGTLKARLHRAREQLRTRLVNANACDAAREWIHQSLDAELMDAATKQRLDDHLSGCAACRERADELRAVQEGLRSLPELKLPDDALEEVWRRTTRSRRTRPWYLAAAAAAITVLVLGGLWLRNGPQPTGPTDAELEQAAREARLVLQFASRALHRTEQAAFRDILTDEVSTALQRVPIQWPERSAEQRRGS